MCSRLECRVGIFPQFYSFLFILLELSVVFQGYYINTLVFYIRWHSFSSVIVILSHRPLVDQTGSLATLNHSYSTFGWPTGSLATLNHSHPDHWLTNRKSGYTQPFSPRPLVDQQEVWPHSTILTPTIGWPTGSLITHHHSYSDHWLTNRKSDHSSPFLPRP